MPKLKFIKNLTQIKKSEWGQPEKVVVFYDAYLVRAPGFKSWIRQFPFSFALKAGESLKTLKSYETLLTQLQNKPLSKDTVFVAIGGGSIGDFVGFLASTFHRGKKLIHVPTTWLSAIDSAHGGKNGLNIRGIKNQIGTFYPAEKIYFIQSLLFFQKSAQVQDAFGEIIKIAIINQPNLIKNIQITDQFIWKNLNQIVKAKYKVIQKDPYEQTGLRQILNLGHTVGHFFESHFKISHGQAVYFGIIFSLRFSLQKGFISSKDFYQIMKSLLMLNSYREYQSSLKVKFTDFKKYLSMDKKKISRNAVKFIFIHKAGKVSRETVTIDQLYQELQRQQKEL